MAEVVELEYTHKDFASDQAIRWCPGCGDYAILNAMQKAMPQIGKKKEDILFISGIGSRGANWMAAPLRLLMMASTLCRIRAWGSITATGCCAATAFLTARSSGMAPAKAGTIRKN